MQMMSPNKHPGILASHPQRLGKSCQADPESEDSWLAKPTGHSKGSVNNGSRYFHCPTCYLTYQEAPRTLTGPCRPPRGLVTHERARVKWKR